jgi:hypothetical protein
MTKPSVMTRQSLKPKPRALVSFDYQITKNTLKQKSMVIQPVLNRGGSRMRGVKSPSTVNQDLEISKITRETRNAQTRQGRWR